MGQAGQAGQGDRRAKGKGGDGGEGEDGKDRRDRGENVPPSRRTECRLSRGNIVPPRPGVRRPAGGRDAPRRIHLPVWNGAPSAERTGERGKAETVQRRRRREEEREGE